MRRPGEFVGPYLNRQVTWEGCAGLVNEDSDKEIMVILTVSCTSDKYTAILEFPPGSRDDLLALNSGQKIKETCVIRKGGLSPELVDCELLKIWD
jgi:hypothetical protein